MQESETEKNTEDEKNFSLANAETITENNDNMLYIGDKKSDKRKGSGDDVMLTQCILCIILVLSVFIIGFINREFQNKLISIYKEMTDSPAEPFLANILENIEKWFQK